MYLAREMPRERDVNHYVLVDKLHKIPCALQWGNMNIVSKLVFLCFHIYTHIHFSKIITKRYCARCITIICFARTDGFPTTVLTTRPSDAEAMMIRITRSIFQMQWKFSNPWANCLGINSHASNATCRVSNGYWTIPLLSANKNHWSKQWLGWRNQMILHLATLLCYVWYQTQYVSVNMSSFHHGRFTGKLNLWQLSMTWQYITTVTRNYNVYSQKYLALTNELLGGFCREFRITDRVITAPHCNVKNVSCGEYDIWRRQKLKIYIQASSTNCQRSSNQCAEGHLYDNRDVTLWIWLV